MILRAFRLVISGATLLMLSAPILAAPTQAAPCHDNYSAGSFEEADEDVQEFIDEYFVSAKIPFLPEKKAYAALKLLRQPGGEYRLPNALQKGGGNRLYPTQPGLWKILDHGTGVREYHLLIREPQQLAQTQAFNTYNDLLGEPFSDYDDQAYALTLQPEDIRRTFDGRYFTINITVYGLRDDATQLLQTVTDVILTDYTTWVHQNTLCQQHKLPIETSANGTSR
jgi:hypothetical protein